MDEVVAYILNICGTDLLQLTIPLILYCIYRNKKRKEMKALLRGKVVLITGANSGLGEEIANVFYKAGCKLILAARRVNELERVKTELLNTKTDNITFEPVVFPLDLSNLETIPRRASEALAIYNEINILINNAGISYRGTILETTLEVQMQVMTVNYFGQIALTQALLSSLIKHKGHIVAISSVQGRIAIPYRSAYAASKHALQAYMDCLRSEISDVNVTVINPGYIKTNLSMNAVTATGKKYEVLDESTAKGYSPEYVAQKVLEAVIMKKQELIISPLWHKMAIFFRILTPSLFFYLIKIWGKRKK